jgi:hypothetical protein
MRSIQIVVTSSFIFAEAFPVTANAQDIFQDLNFESATVPNGSSTGSFIPISDALPGWNGYLINTSTSITTSQTQVSYDGISTGGAGISLIDSASGVQPLQGNYSVFLFGGGAPSVVSAEISQTALIPFGMNTLLMEAWTFNASPVVAVDGQTITMTPMQTIPDANLYGGYYTLYGGNISSFAGARVTLSFTDPAPTSDAPSQFLLDNISFSPVATPEPTPLILTGIGGLIFALHRRLRQR